MASRKPLIQSAWCIPTRRTHQARASLRLRATPPATSVSRIDRSFMRRRVITGMLSVVKIFISSPHLAPQATLRPNCRSASRAIRIRSSRDSSRNRRIRATRAAERASSEVPPASSTSGSTPTTRISSPSEVTSGEPTNQPFGIREANQRASSADIGITRLRPGPPPARSLSSGSCLRGLRPHEVELVDDDLRPVALLPGLVLPTARLEAAVGVDQAALVQVLAGKLGELAESNQAVELGLFLAFALRILAGIGVGGDAHLGDVRAFRRRLDVRVRRQVPDENDFVDHCDDLREIGFKLCGPGTDS